MARLQGTDGIRATTVPASTHCGLGPVDAFVKKNVITEEFVELYVYCYSKMSKAKEVVIGWDPRDTEGTYTDAAMRGIRKAGCDCVCIGIAATPCIAMYTVWRDAKAAVVVSASHNFKTQNGIKLFKEKGMKLLPDEDVLLTDIILHTPYDNIKYKPETGGFVNMEREARTVFENFHLDPRNAWSTRIPIQNGPLVVDPANGALSHVAADVLRKMVTCEVIEVNNDTKSGNVNVDGGVADLEDVTVIERTDINFKSHKAVSLLFEKRSGWAAVFDADGDRFYGLAYNPPTDTVLVLSGDEAAVNISSHVSPKKDFIITVESDLEAGRAAAARGFTPILTGVGDKWLLSRAMSHPMSFSVACEASGHNITRGVLTTSSGSTVDFFSGNGLKAAVNTFAVMASGGFQSSPGEFAVPFKPGYKKTFYVFYTDKTMLRKGSVLIQNVEKKLKEMLHGMGTVKVVPFAEEPDMLYISLSGADGVQTTGIFIRNSGTEEKTGINVRGRKQDADVLGKIGLSLSMYLFSVMKNASHPMALGELAVLQSLQTSSIPTVPSNVHKERLLKEMCKGGLIQRVEKGYQTTHHGLNCLRSKAKSSL
eukprot:TRINITY_DN5294_c0_g3_i1.p1 TRINITY_DN5294_c0_g3~~TRINITY_DN5294_c0_g3_i1.p1  ORF type:complete len:609 (+),score=129.02 TRINITY_DN5294_c0_g3_i1:47-1828(+)